MFLNHVVGYGRWPSARGAMIFLVDNIGLVTSYNSWFGKGSDRSQSSRSVPVPAVLHNAVLLYDNGSESATYLEYLEGIYLAHT